MTAPQRIRFAPLPDPRRSVIITDDGQEHPLPEDCDEKVEPASIPEHFSLAIIGLASGKVETTTAAKGSPTPTRSTTPAPSTTTTEKKRSSFLQLFRSFFHHHHASPTEQSSLPSYDSISSTSSTSSSTSTSSSVSTHSVTQPQSNTTKSESTPTPTPTPKSKAPFYGPSPSKDLHLNFGSGLFRTSSREPPGRRPRSGSTASSSSGFGSVLSRWASGGSMKHREKELGFGVPLYRTQSTQSYKRSKQLAKEARASGLLSSLHSSQNAPGDGTRMLNGRVYGAKRNGKGLPQRNHFDTIKSDSGNDDFVEWGYGGMGSVKHQKSGVGGTVWGRLASEGGTWGNQNDDEDDGSGMSWVRQRRAQREREAKEKAEAEANAEQQSMPIPTLSPTRSSSPSQVQRTSSRTVSSSPPHLSSSDNEAEHVRVMNVPAPRPHHSHTRKVSQGMALPPPEEPLNNVREHDDKASKSTIPTTTPSTSLEFDSSSDNEEEASPIEQDTDEEEEEDDDAAARERLSKLSMGAGVEKVSAHHGHR